jgi:hypothetical protein
MNLTTHFTLEELFFSETALRNNIDNTTQDPVILGNLQYLANQLEPIRDLLGHPIHINSAYRCLAVNTLLGSKDTSYHCKGLAADIICPSFGTPRDIIEAIIKSDIQYDQLIWEYQSWCHIGFAMPNNKPRMQKLIIDKQGTRVYE